MRRAFMALCVFTLFAATAQAEMYITEWMYNGLMGSNVGEFVEFTNTGTVAIDMTGWSFDDSSRTPNMKSLSDFGTVEPGESVVLTDANAESFRSSWNLPLSVKIIGGNNQNLGRGDEINLYSITGGLVDRLTYNDETLGGPRTQNVSGNPSSPSVLGANAPAGWILSSVSDGFGSGNSSYGEVGNPGSYPVPEPASIVLVLIGMAGLVALRRRWA